MGDKSVAIPFHIRKMDLKDKNEVLKLLVTVNGHSGTHTIDTIIAHDPDGIIVAVHDETSKKLSIFFPLKE